MARDLYVDNILSSVKTESDALQYFNESRKLMDEAGFNLRSWSSNSEKLCNKALEEKVLDTDKHTKILGLRWNTKADELLSSVLLSVLPQNHFSRRDSA